MTVKSATTFSKQKLPLLNGQVKQFISKELARELNDCEGLGALTDMWTSRSNDSYISATLHFINKNFELKKFVLACQPFSGQHTAAALAKALYKVMQTDLSFLRASTQRIAVHNSAANIKAAIPKTVEITDSLLCADHLINLVLQKANEKKIFKYSCHNGTSQSSEEDNNDINKAIKQAQDFSAKVHRSSNCQNDIKKKCQENEVSYVKIITDCLTRWNSKSMMITSVIRLREVLEELRDSKCEFADVTPSENQFLLLVEVQPILDSFRKVSKVFSADKHPTLHLACSQLVNLQMKVNYIAQLDIQSATKGLVQIRTGELNRRFPNSGTKNHYHAMGNFLHPFFKGALVKKYGDLEGLKDRLVNEHPSHQEFLSQIRNASLNLTGSGFDFDEAEKMASEMPGEEILFRDGKSKIKIELDTYKGLPRPNSSNTDTLKWWEAHAKMIPLLSQVAKKYLAIPLTFASSERVF
ncbi:zinc finger BED domain-containing protein 4-like [Hydra vulgaris]|uniref:Zinc finger BED domain-containing protein 4-like n=1 Tax=Hydra vulgaris TaxID=6087 RepID=A0ABM4CU79_HYDVU